MENRKNISIWNNTVSRIIELKDRDFEKGIFLISFLIRVIVVFIIGNYTHPMIWENGTIADNIVAGKGYVIGFLGPEGYTSWQAPFYPYFLSLFYITFGKNAITFFLIEIVQSIATSLVPIFIYKSAKILFDKKVALVSSILLVPFPLLLWYSTRIHHTAFVFLAISTIFFLFLDSEMNGRFLDYAITGVFLGLSLLIEPVIIIFFFAFIIWRCLKYPVIESLKKYLITGLLALIVITPWTIRNYNVHGKLIFIKSSFGKEFWMGNNPHTTGTGFVEGGGDEITISFPPLCFDDLKNHTEIERSQMLLHESMTWIKENPGDFVRLTLKKAFYFLWYPPTDIVRHQEGGESVKYEFLKKTYWVIFSVFLIYGIFLAWRERNHYIWIILLICLFYISVYSFTHVGQQRFRGVIEPVLIIYASYGLITIAKKLRLLL